MFRREAESPDTTAAPPPCSCCSTTNTTNTSNALEPVAALPAALFNSVGVVYYFGFSEVQVLVQQQQCISDPDRDFQAAVCAGFA